MLPVEPSPLVEAVADPTPPPVIPLPPEPRADESVPPPKSPNAFLAEAITLTFPLPIALPYRRVLTEPDPLKRLTNLCLAAVALVRYVAVLAVSDLIRMKAESPSPGLPAHPVFDFLRRKQNLSFGDWRTVAHMAAKELRSDKARVFDELPNALTAGSEFDTAMSQLNAVRNLRIGHPEGEIPTTEGEAREAFDTAHPAYLRVVRAVHFVSGYALGFAREYASFSNKSAHRYKLHGCVGWWVAQAESEVAVEKFPSPLQLDAPFVMTPDQTRLLHLWPMLTAGNSGQNTQPALFTFTQLTKAGRFASEVDYHAVSVRDQCVRRWHTPPPADDGWLFRTVTERYAPLTLPLPDGRGYADRMLRRTKDMIGVMFGDYRLEAVLGRGGCGTVYTGVAADGRRVAVKVLHEEGGEEAVKRFLTEHDRLRQSDHSGLIRVYEPGEEDTPNGIRYWFAMEYAAGGDLAARIRGRQPAIGLPWDDPTVHPQLVAEFRQIARVVAHLHENGLVHRDIKPANVLVMTDGTLRLSDFGLVKVLAPSAKTQAWGPRTVTGASVGTQEYMPPEQFAGADPRPTADVYSLGILLAELAFGERPKHRTDTDKKSTLADCPELNRLPQPLRDFLLRCTRVSPEDRPVHAAAVFTEFDRVVTECPPAAS